MTGFLISRKRLLSSLFRQTAHFLRTTALHQTCSLLQLICSADRPHPLFVNKMAYWSYELSSLAKLLIVPQLVSLADVPVCKYYT